MINSLLKRLVAVKPREISGSRSSNRFDFQKDWAICELLRLHLQENDYLLIFDYHEDVVALDSEFNPKSAKFYQIKSKKSGNWTVNELCKCDKKKKNDHSILKKLFSNYSLCPNEVKNLVFISNQGIKASLKDGSNGLNYLCVTFIQFSDDDKTKIHECIEGKDAELCSVQGLNLISIQKTNLTINDHDVFVKGKLVDFFSEIAPEKGVKIDLAYKILFDEIKRRNNSEIECLSFADLKKVKGLGREEFKGMVSMFTAHTSNADYWEQANNLLLSEKFKISEIRKIKAAWNKYTIEILNSLDGTLPDKRKILIREIQKFERTHLEYDLKELLYDVKQKVNFSDIPTLENEPNIIEAAIIYEVMINDPVSKTCQKFEEETV